MLLKLNKTRILYTITLRAKIVYYYWFHCKKLRHFHFLNKQKICLIFSLLEKNCIWFSKYWKGNYENFKESKATNFKKLEN